MLTYEGIQLCTIVFFRCAQYWKLSVLEVAQLFETYKLVSFICDNRVYLNEFGVKGVVNVLRDYILEQGGPYFEDVV